MDIEVRNVEGATGLMRIRRQRGAIRFRYAGALVSRIPADLLAAHLAKFGSGELSDLVWDEVVLSCGKGEVRLSLRREVVNHLLTDQNRKDLATLAAKPG